MSYVQKYGYTVAKCYFRYMTSKIGSQPTTLMPKHPSYNPMQPSPLRHRQAYYTNVQLVSHSDYYSMEMNPSQYSYQFPSFPPSYLWYASFGLQPSNSNPMPSQDAPTHYFWAINVWYHLFNSYFWLYELIFYVCTLINNSYYGFSSVCTVYIVHYSYRSYCITWNFQTLLGT